MLNLGTVRPGSTIRIPFSSFDKDDGSSITMTNYAAADILVYKDGGTTERASTAGFTATTDFDTKTGKHLAVIDLADNTTSGFWNAGSEYLVAIDAVTVDAVTTGGWIARFVIGYPNAILNTTIATLSSQTSFTLTVGPAEDDALNGMWAVIHDIASAVQLSKVLISDYTGSTKTVTLAAGATFTAAAGDNFSVIDLAPVQPTVTGRTLDVSSTGEAGIDWANIGSPTTAVNLSATNIDTDQVVASVTGAVGSVTGAVGSVTGNVGGNVTGSVGSVTAGVTVTTNNDKTGYALSAAGVDAIWDEATAGHVTAGSYGVAVTDILTDTAEIGAAGAGLTNINLPDQTMNITGNITGNLSGSVGSVTGAVGSVTGNVGGNVTGSVGSVAAGGIAASSFAAGAIDAAALAANAGAEIADAVWDELLSGHVISGSAGEALAAAGTAGDPWTTALPGAYGAGTAGFIVGTNLDTTVSSRLSTAGYSAPPSAATIADAVWDEDATAHQTQGTFGQAIGDPGIDTDTIFGLLNTNLDATVSSRLASASYTAPLDAAGTRSAIGLASANLDTQLTAIDDFLDTEVAAILADTNELQTDWTNGGRLDLLIDAIKAKTDNLPAVPAAVGDIPTATQNADAILARNVAGGSDGTRTVSQALYVLRNKTAISGGTLTVYGTDDTTPSFTAAVTTTAGNPISEIDPA